MAAKPNYQNKTTITSLHQGDRPVGNYVSNPRLAALQKETQNKLIDKEKPPYSSASESREYVSNPQLAALQKRIEQNIENKKLPYSGGRPSRKSYKRKSSKRKSSKRKSSKRKSSKRKSSKRKSSRHF